MSFDYNAFKHIELIKTDDGKVHSYCHSCGGEFGEHTDHAPVAVFFDDMADHIKKSHKRTPEDMKDWSVY